jgi:hypothetical protein
MLTAASSPEGGAGMGTEENKAVVRRFMNEVLAGGNLDVADEVLAYTSSSWSAIC